MKESKKKKVYFGTGLASMKEPSIGVGLGTLGMVMAAIEQCHIHNTDTILHEIGTGYNLPPDILKQLTDSQMTIWNKMSMGLKKRGINLIHNMWNDEYINNSTYLKYHSDAEKRLQDTLGHIPNYRILKKYSAIQTAGVKLAIDNGVVSKIGWTPKGTTHDMEQMSIEEIIEAKKINEYYFDRLIEHCYPGTGLDTRYIAGDIDWQNGYRKSPYTVTAEETRPLVDTKLEKSCEYKKTNDALVDINKKIVQPYEKLYGEIKIKKQTGEEIIDKVSEIQRQILGI